MFNGVHISGTVTCPYNAYISRTKVYRWRSCHTETSDEECQIFLLILHLVTADSKDQICSYDRFQCRLSHTVKPAADNREYSSELASIPGSVTHN